MSGQDSAESREDEAVARFPAWFAVFPLEDADLMPEGEHLGAELGARAGANEAEVGEEAGKRVGRLMSMTADHDRSMASISQRSAYRCPGRTKSWSQTTRRTDCGGFTAHPLDKRWRLEFKEP